MTPETNQECSDCFILGISAFYHDSAASLINNGNIIAAAQEERFTRRKHDRSFPFSAINYCLEEAEIDFSDIDYVVFYDNPLIKFERIISNHLTVYPQGTEQWQKMLPRLLSTNLSLPEIIRKHMPGFKGKFFYGNHHLSHASSAFFPSPFQKSAILTIDGVGEWATATIGFGEDNKLKIIKQMNYPDSLGLLYSAFTFYTGFVVNRGEYKLMGLAPYGKPRYVDSIKKNLVNINTDGSINLNLDYFSFTYGMEMTNSKFNELFGGPPRTPESKITQKEMDLARSIQVVTEDVVLKMAAHARDLTKSSNLCLAGGVALNCVANGKLLKEGLFDDIWIQPAAGSLGAALAFYYERFEPERLSGTSIQGGSYWGPSFRDSEIESYLSSHRKMWKGMYDFVRVDEKDRAEIIADLISQNKIVAHFAGRMEFGPRALGSRSILGDPRDINTQSVMNLKIKNRESFRPFAPTVIEENIGDYFEIDRPSPYMLLVAQVKKERCTKSETNEDIIKWVNQKRSDIPAVTHVDYSARIQSVSKKFNSQYYNIINEFNKKTGCGILVNTSFNIRGEPIVCTPHEAVNCFMSTDINVLAIENFILTKNDIYEKFEKNRIELSPSKFS